MLEQQSGNKTEINHIIKILRIPITTSRAQTFMFSVILALSDDEYYFKHITSSEEDKLFYNSPSILRTGFSRQKYQFFRHSFTKTSMDL